MVETQVIGRVRLSSSWTSFVKYFPLIIGAFGTMIVIATEQSENAIIPISILLVGFATNVFIVDMTVDKDFIYIKQWMKEQKYPIDNLDKVGDFKRGMTIVDIKTKASTRTFLIINDFGNSLYLKESKDISGFLLKLKAGYSQHKNKGQGIST